MRTHAGPVRLTLLIAAIAMAIPAPTHSQQPDPAPAAKIHVDGVEVNLSLQPRFNFVVMTPTALRFESVQFNGVQLLHIWAYSRVDSIDAHIRRVPTDRPDANRPRQPSPLQAPLPERSTQASSSSGLRAPAVIGTLIISRRLYRSRRDKIS